jgi:hypothetical protein
MGMVSPSPWREEAVLPPHDKKSAEATRKRNRMFVLFIV